MPRWRPDGLARLEEAAAELFDEQGYDATSVGQIAARAGLTQRTFYNHFSDKREVLFGRSSQFQAQVVDAIGACVGTLAPLDAVVRALQEVSGTMFDENRPAVLRREGIIRANQELQERDLAKQATLTAAIAEVLRGSGVEHETAALAASAGLLVHQAAITTWTRPGETRPLSQLVAHTLDSLRAAIEPQAVVTAGVVTASVVTADIVTADVVTAADTGGGRLT